MDFAVKTVVPAISIIGLIATIFYACFLHKSIQDIFSDLTDTRKMMSLLRDALDDITKKALPDMINFKKETKNIQEDMRNQLSEQDETMEYMVKHQETLRMGINEVQQNLTSEDSKIFKTSIPDKFEYYTPEEKQSSRWRRGNTTMPRRRDDRGDEDGYDDASGHKRRGRY